MIIWVNDNVITNHVGHLTQDQMNNARNIVELDENGNMRIIKVRHPDKLIILGRKFQRDTNDGRQD
jgi:hypothetical protein